MEVKQLLSSVKQERPRPVQAQDRPGVTPTLKKTQDYRPEPPVQSKPSHPSNYNLLLIGRFALDIAAINVAFGLAYVARYVFLGADVLERNQVSLGDYLPIELGFTAIFFVLLQFKGYYRQTRNSSLLDETGTIFSTALLSVATLMVLIFIGQPDTRSRLMLVYLLPLSFGCVFGLRLMATAIRRWQWRRGIGVRNLIVVGATDAASRLMQTLVERPKLGYRLVGYVDDATRFSQWTLPARYPSGELVPHIGTNQDLIELTRQHAVEEVIVALPASMHETINTVISQCREYDVEFTLVPDIFELRVDLLNFQQINGVPVIGFKANALTGWNYVVKRLSDIVLCVIALLICSIPLLLISIAIKLDSPGPIIHRQTRIGKNGKPFTFFKFRSMYVNADEIFEKLQQFNTTGGATFKMVDDPRRTRVGRFLRRTSLDELPQVLNILAGQMSWVGPRPAIDRELPKFNEWQFRRFEATPGLTGLWQVSGRSNLPFDDMVKLDIYYTENWSLWLDLKIMLRTVPAVLTGRGAY